jgi:regulatory protein
MCPFAARGRAAGRTRHPPEEPPAPLSPERAAQKACASGLYMLARHEMSEARLRARLAEKEHSPAAIDAAVNRLRDIGALDELRAARACARTLVHVKLRGRLRARRELEHLGFDQGTASQVLDELLDPAAERTLLSTMLLRHVRGRNANLGDPAVFRRVHGALVRRGFSPAQVRTLMLGLRRGSGAAEVDDASDSVDE